MRIIVAVVVLWQRYCPRRPGGFLVSLLCLIILLSPSVTYIPAFRSPYTSSSSWLVEGRIVDVAFSRYLQVSTYTKGLVAAHVNWWVELVMLLH